MEKSQNSYLTGILKTLANYIIGTGPRLQMQMVGPDGKPNKELNADIESEFRQWAKHAKLAAMLRTAVSAKVVDGEVFLSVVANSTMRDSTGYGLALQLFESEQVREESMYSPKARDDGGDGIRYDRFGNPTKYPVLRKHPGETSAYSEVTSSIQWIPEEYMCHMYNVERPGQKRGVSEILTALPLFAMLRRMTLATVCNVEKSANIQGVLETEAEVDDLGNSLSSISDEDWMAQLPTGRNTLLTLPNGMHLKEFMSAQPNTEYNDFQKSVIREIARCLCIPYAVAAGDSSDSNYSSGRLDHQSFHAANNVQRCHIECTCLDMILSQFLKVYYAREYGTDDVDTYNVAHTWRWSAVDDVDPAKTALADDRMLRYGGTSRGAVMAKRGLDVDTEDEKAAYELGYDDVRSYRQAIARYLHGEEPADTDADGDNQEDSVKESRPNSKPENSDE